MILMKSTWKFGENCWNQYAAPNTSFKPTDWIICSWSGIKRFLSSGQILMVIRIIVFTSLWFPVEWWHASILRKSEIVSLPLSSRPHMLAGCSLAPHVRKPRRHRREDLNLTFFYELLNLELMWYLTPWIIQIIFYHGFILKAVVKLWLAVANFKDMQKRRTLRGVWEPGQMGFKAKIDFREWYGFGLSL